MGVKRRGIPSELIHLYCFFENIVEHSKSLSVGLFIIGLLSLLLSGIFFLQASGIFIVIAMPIFFLGIFLLKIANQYFGDNQQKGLKSVSKKVGDDEKSIGYGHHAENFSPTAQKNDLSQDQDAFQLVLTFNDKNNNLHVLETIHLAIDKIHSIEFPRHAKELVASIPITLRISSDTQKFSFNINPINAANFNQLMRFLKQYPHIHYYPYRGLKLPATTDSGRC